MPYFRIAGEKSTVRIRARSTVHTVVAESRAVEGFIEAQASSGQVDLGAMPRACLDIPVASLASGNLLYDREMRRRVDGRRFPVIRGELVEMAPTGLDGRYRVSGLVTVRGVTCDYTDEMELRWPSAETLSLTGAHRFDLRDFGLEPPKLAMLRVLPEVDVEVSVVARRESPFVPDARDVRTGGAGS